MTKTIIAPVMAAALALMPVHAGATSHSHHYQRSRRVTEEFQQLNPCPSTGKTYGACPGWIKDHIVALCKGGADAVWNLQWQTVAEAKAKDKWECK
jgi:hypothetical protein